MSGLVQRLAAVVAGSPRPSVAVPVRAREYARAAPARVQGVDQALVWLTIVAFVLMFGSFFVLAQWGGEPAGSHYVPAHMENGKLVPGTT